VDLVDKIMRYEQDELHECEIVELFQELVDNGDAWKLQGHYGRTAQALIDVGLVTPHAERCDSSCPDHGVLGTQTWLGIQKGTR
jgi:hypothetical protein